MEWVEILSPDLAEVINWLTSPETKIPVVKLLQGFAAVIAILGSSLGVYKTWHFAERKLGLRLSEFLDKEKEKLKEVRANIRQVRNDYAAAKFPSIHIRTNEDLHYALKKFRRNKLSNIEEELKRAGELTSDKINLAREKLDLHEKQRALIYLLLGADAASKGLHGDALTHFQSALELDEHDAETREYVGDQYLKIGNAGAALAHFDKVIANAQGDELTLARVHRKRGEAFEMPPNIRPGGANVAYRDAIEVFPDNGPLIEIALIHELRGKVNISPGNFPLAGDSLQNALFYYNQIQLNGKGKLREAKDGAARVEAARQELNSQQNGA